MGSALFAVPSLEALASSRHQILEVVTQPDKPAGRGRRIAACPAAHAASRLGLALYQPWSVKKAESIDHIRGLAPDMIAVVAYGRILPNMLLEIPQHGCVNVHASLLPKYRGAAPINWAIVNGDSETGVTTQRIGEEVDAGDILLAASTPIGDEETASELHDRLASIGADLLLKTIEGIERGTISPAPQEHSKATFAPIIKKEDGRIDWSMPARDIFNRVRGFAPWPGTFTILDGRLLHIHKAAPADIGASELPGTVIENAANLTVACGMGALYLLEVQIEGRRRMNARDFLRGHKIKVGTILT